MNKTSLTPEELESIRLKRNEYQRKYYSLNKDKRKAWNDKYFLKKCKNEGNIANGKTEVSTETD